MVLLRKHKKSNQCSLANVSYIHNVTCRLQSKCRRGGNGSIVQYLTDTYFSLASSKKLAKAIEMHTYAYMSYAIEVIRISFVTVPP